MKNTSVKLLLLFLFIGIHSYSKSIPNKIKDLAFPDAEYITENTIRIPFKLADHLIIVKAKANNRVGNFIIDTGAETLILNKVHFNNFHQHRSRRTSGVSSSVDNVFMTKLNKFFINTFNIENINSDIVDLSHIEKSKRVEILGIIGYQVIKEYEIFIDFYLKQITLFKTDKNGNRIDKEILLEKIVDSIPFNLKKHTIVINGYVNNEKLNFGLDSGAEINQLNTTVSKKVRQNFRIVKRVHIIGVGKRKREVIAGKLYGVKFTKKTYSGMMRTLLTNLSGMKDSYGTNLDGILGYEFLAMKRLIINYKKQKLYFINQPFTKN